MLYASVHAKPTVYHYHNFGQQAVSLCKAHSKVGSASREILTPGNQQL